MALSNYNRFDDEDRLGLGKKVALFLFVFLYPMFVSMYTILPPLIGLAGYIFIVNLNSKKVYSLGAFLYLINLDLNLTLPLFLSTAIVVLIFMFMYKPLKRLIRCRVCLIFVLIVLVDFIYYLTLFIYDFIFNTLTVIGDMLLVYYIVIDILIGVML